MHIAWLGKKSPFCGNVIYSCEVIKALVERGRNVSFIHYNLEDSDLLSSVPWSSLKPKNDCPSGWPKLPEVSIPCLYKSTYAIVQSPKSCKVLTEALQDLNPDLVHVSAPVSFLDAQLPDICQSLDLPLVATFHMPFDSNQRFNIASSTQMLWYRICARALARCDRTIVFSDIQKEFLVRSGVPGDRVVVIPNGVDALKYSPGPSNFKQEIAAERVFVYQGRLAIEKNVEALLKAWKLAQMKPGSKLVIVGDGPLRSSLQAACEGDSSIVWLGYVPDEARRIDILRGADVFVLPSLVEGLSLSLLEAMACGVACLATDVGADGEVVENGAGVALEAHRAAAQLQTLLPLFQDHPELARILGYKARQRVLERYTLGDNITQVERLYEAVLQGTSMLSGNRPIAN